jgi:hypothetical protein
MLRTRLFLFLLFTGWFLPGQAQAGDPKPVRLDVTVKEADASLDSEWFGIYVKGTKIGYFNALREKVTENGQTFYREKSVMSMKLKSFDQLTELTTVQVTDFDAKPPFRMLRTDYSHVDDKTKVKITLAPKGKGYEATIVVAGVTQTKQFDNLDYTMADSLSSEVWLRRRPRKGDSIATADLEVEDLEMQVSTTKLIDTKETMVNGVRTTMFEVQTVNHKTQVESRAFYDAKARMISADMQGLFELRRETEEAAKDTEYSIDLFNESLAKVDKAIGTGSTVTALVLEIKAKEAAVLPNGPRQTLVAKKGAGDDVFLLKLGKKYGKDMKATPEEIADSLKETTAYPIEDAKVKALAKKAIGDAKTDEEKVKNLCKFVKNYIRPSLSASMPRMHDLIQRKSGDCKSYALMFTCLARAAGLPSREVSGFVYIGDDDKAFGGHAWNEVVLNGVWVPIDASMNETELDATHISLGTDKESSSNLLKTFGKLNFKLVQVEGGN